MEGARDGGSVREGDRDEGGEREGDRDEGRERERRTSRERERQRQRKKERERKRAENRENTSRAAQPVAPLFALKTYLTIWTPGGLSMRNTKQKVSDPKQFFGFCFGRETFRIFFV